jgi:hypothetical protein
MGCHRMLVDRPGACSRRLLRVEKVGLPETKYERDLRYVGWYVILFLSYRTRF